MFLTSMMKTVLMSLFGKPATRLYPFETREPFALTRGHIEIDIESCIFCSICQKKCPTDAITVDRLAQTWAINRLACIQCNYCVESCPKKCLSMNNQYASSVGAEKPHQDLFSKTTHA